MNTSNLQQTMRDAMALMRTGDLNAATAAIQRGLDDGTGHAPRPAPGAYPFTPGVIDGECHVVPESASPIVTGSGGTFNESPVAEPHDTAIDERHQGVAAAAAPSATEPTDRSGAPLAARTADERRPAAGQTVTAGTFSCAHGQRDYVVYAPSEPGLRQPPLLLMLHGCTQNAADFARGTRMHERAASEGYVVVYPTQALAGNPNGCWNWFRAADQQRGSGEPALLAGLAVEMTRRFNCDPRRVFVAGLSAGAAMAVNLGRLYPDIFHGVGTHSGLPYGSATDVPSAMMAMRNANARGAGVARRDGVETCVPTIVFHGDRDHTVNIGNARRIIDDARPIQSHDSASANGVWSETATTGQVAGGHRFTTLRVRDAAGKLQLESWTVHGAGHAWSGGSPQGSYTDARGPDATGEMLRFFGELG